MKPICCQVVVSGRGMGEVTGMLDHGSETRKKDWGRGLVLLTT